MNDAPRSYASPLESHPEYVQAIGMLTIEIACLERMLANLLCAILGTDTATAEAIYFTPRSNMARVDILANVAAKTLYPRPALLTKVYKLVKQSKKALEKRHNIVHSEYRIDVVTSEVVISALSGKGRALEPYPKQNITNAVKEVRTLIIQSLDIVRAVHESERSLSKKSRRPNPF